MPRPASHSVHVVALGFWLSRLAESGRALACRRGGAGREGGTTKEMLRMVAVLKLCFRVSLSAHVPNEMFNIPVENCFSAAASGFMSRKRAANRTKREKERERGNAGRGNGYLVDAAAATL